MTRRTTALVVTVAALLAARPVRAQDDAASPGSAWSGTAEPAAEEPAPTAEPAPAGEAAPAGAAAPGAPGDADSGVTFDRQLLTIEERVHSLKEQVFRSKATLQLLREIVVQGTASGARATVWHVNRLGPAYRLESIAYYLDGQAKFSKADPAGGLDEMREFKVFEGAVPPGNHSLTVNLTLRGNGFGIFSYVREYTFNVQATTSFVAEEGKSCTVRVIPDERKGIGRSFVERPNVRFEVQCVRLSDTVDGD